MAHLEPQIRYSETAIAMTESPATIQPIALGSECLMPRYTLFFLNWDDVTVATEDVEAQSDAAALLIVALGLL